MSFLGGGVGAGTAEPITSPFHKDSSKAGGEITRINGFMERSKWGLRKGLKSEGRISSGENPIF